MPASSAADLRPKSYCGFTTRGTSLQNRPGIILPSLVKRCAKAVTEENTEKLGLITVGYSTPKKTLVIWMVNANSVVLPYATYSTYSTKNGSH